LSNCRRRASYTKTILKTTITSSEECETINDDLGINASNKWEYAASTTTNDSIISDDENEDPNGESNSNNNNNMIRNLLVCGDGDLSYSAEIASELDDLGIELFATVLEDEETHNQVYQYSKSNTDSIASSGQNTMFGVDATDLSTYFGSTNEEEQEEDKSTILFDRIQFNFPHWRGKANNRYNRQLLNDFFKSAATALSARGEIHVALCDGQGG